MLGDFERWAQSPNGNYLDAEGAWKACAAIKDAEIEACSLIMNGQFAIMKSAKAMLIICDQR